MNQIPQRKRWIISIVAITCLTIIALACLITQSDVEWQTIIIITGTIGSIAGVAGGAKAVNSIKRRRREKDEA